MQGEENRSLRGFLELKLGKTSGDLCGRTVLVVLPQSPLKGKVGSVRKIFNEDRRIKFWGRLAGWVSGTEQPDEFQGRTKILQFSARFVARLFTYEQKQSLVFMCQTLLDKVGNDQN
jgi:hypothetical protein